MSDDGSRSWTEVGRREWRARPAGYRAWEGSVGLGTGDAVWRRAREEVLRWGVKTRSGFTVDPALPASHGQRPVIVARLLGLSVTEPVEIVDVVDTDERAGFAYRTLPGHPIRGEEAFIVARAGDEVTLAIRSLTRASEHGCWRRAYPLLLIAQKVARRRYLRALRPDESR